MSGLRRQAGQREYRRHQGAARNPRRFHRPGERGQSARRVAGIERWRRHRGEKLLGGEPCARQTEGDLGRRSDRCPKQRGLRAARRRARQGSACVLSAPRRRRCVGDQERHACRGSELFLSVPRPYQPRTAELHRALSGRQGRVLGADATAGARRQAGGGDARDSREQHHRQHDAHGRRLRPALAQRLSWPRQRGSREK